MPPYCESGGGGDRLLCPPSISMHEEADQLLICSHFRPNTSSLDEFQIEVVAEIMEKDLNIPQLSVLIAYNIVVHAENSVGWGPTSNVITFEREDRETSELRYQQSLEFSTVLFSSHRRFNCP